MQHPPIGRGYYREPTKHEQLLDTARELKKLVEGVHVRDWRDSEGVRLKDTEAWVKFYNAVERFT